MVTIEIKKGDITKLKVDAIVNAANNELWMGGGVAGAIKMEGGRQIEEEAVKKGPIPVGQAIVTGGGLLPARYVIHAAVMGTDFQTDSEKIRLATLHSLRRADEEGLRTVAFPALGTGVGRFPADECARIMIKEIQDYAGLNTGLQKVIIVLYSEDIYRVFKEEYEWIQRRTTISDQYETEEHEG